jgi:cobalt-zinc-cadmium efflux system outer membrane protein
MTSSSRISFPHLLPISLVGLVGLAVGCSGYEPRPLDPASDLEAFLSADPSTLAHPESRSVSEIAAPGVALDSRDGLDEDELVVLALSWNADLQVLRLEIGQARSILLEAGLWPDPELGFAWRPGLSAPGTTLDGELLFEIVRPWERSAAKRAAEAGVDERRAAVAEAEWALVAALRSGHAEVLALGEEVRLLEEETALRRRVFDLVRGGRDSGERTELDLSAATLDLEEAERAARGAATARETALRALWRLAGLPPEGGWRLEAEGATALPEGDPFDPEMRRRVLLSPSLRAGDAALRRAEEELKLAWHRRLPRLRLGPSTNAEPDGDYYLGFALGLELPLWNRNQGDIAAKESLRDRARAEYSARIRALWARAVDARERLRRAREELEIQASRVLPTLARARELHERAFREREVGVLEWALLEERALRARLEAVRAALRARLAWIDLEAALGPPTPELAVPAVETKPED